MSSPVFLFTIPNLLLISLVYLSHILVFISRSSISIFLYLLCSHLIFEPVEWNVKCFNVLVILTCISRGSILVDFFLFIVHFIFLLFVYLVIFAKKPGIVNFTPVVAGHIFISISILEIYSASQLSWRNSLVVLGFPFNSFLVLGYSLLRQVASKYFTKYFMN